MIKIKSGKKAGIIIAILVVIIVAVALVSFKQNEEPTTAKSQLTLADYPEIFKKDVIIVIGENANSIEIEVAQRIADNLGNLTGNMPVIKTDAEITEDELAGHDLILAGGADSNEVLQKVYDMTDAIRVTEEYPGAGKGVLEILRNPWDPEKAMLLVAGSDEWGVKAGSMELEQFHELNMTSVVTEWGEFRANKRLKYIWFNGDQEEQVFVALDEVAIFLKNVSETTDVKEKLVQDFDQQAVLIKDYEFVILIRLPDRLDVTTIEDKIDEFQNTTGNTANFVFYQGPKKDQTPMVLTGEIIVHFRQDWDENIIAGWAKGMGLKTIKSFSFSPNTYLFEVDSGIISLELANQIYLSGEVIYAYPNWWKAMELKGNQAILNDTNISKENKFSTESTYIQRRT